MKSNMSVKNMNTGMIHWGTVDTATQTVTRTHCLKPMGDQYAPAIGETVTCAVCRTKLAGKVVGYRSRAFHKTRRR